MKFGEKLKQLRSDANLSQPELSDLAGVEQSYLSKLENDHSVPSGDILNQLLGVLKVDMQEFLAGIDSRSQMKLQQIPEVAQFLNQTRISIIENRKRWLLICAICCVLGAGLIAAGQTAVFFPERVFQYTSHGVVLPGESNEVFSNWHESVNRLVRSNEADAAANEAARETRRQEMYGRKAEVYRVTSQFKGAKFIVPVNGGSRTFSLKKDGNIARWQNKFLMVIGVMFLVSGLLGMVIERKSSVNSLQ